MNKRVFDGIIIVSLLLHPAVGLLKMAARRWSTESADSPLGVIGSAVEVSL
jgi:hypothetical protein